MSSASSWPTNVGILLLLLLADVAVADADDVASQSTASSRNPVVYFGNQTTTTTVTNFSRIEANAQQLESAVATAAEAAATTATERLRSQLERSATAAAEAAATAVAERLSRQLKRAVARAEAAATAAEDVAAQIKAERFHPIQEMVTWAEAYDRCAAVGQRLAIIDSALAHKAALVVQQAHYRWDFGMWIGASDQNVEGQFEWKFTGARVAWTTWMENQPDNENSTQQCVVMSSDATGNWHDNDCSDRRNYLCEEYYKSAVVTLNKSAYELV